MSDLENTENGSSGILPPKFPLAPDLPDEKLPNAQKEENEWPKIIDGGIKDAIDVLRQSLKHKHEIACANIGIDKGILLVLAIALLASLFFMFYLMTVDKPELISHFLYPTITGLVGLFLGYLAGSGRRGERTTK